ncbi:hypothetical protein [Acinetobacter tjernbergiae]|uniref:Uncharacterized protein n=1 Tax=Acinetobacter tjernbergiae DSM 14971 = CIP 107465 TaxID=1120928 RepID=V2V2L3_9GAMM|nr:hypothetical protein [Acinetobacter tjernbergiae]ESK56497.1 hypothetical protein F990_01058 [Acinetobacter tjernbergiae DSM 14971 = CIP 107465]
MKANMNHEIVVNAEAFAIATQMYVRLRRVSGRVIDVMYLVHDKDYARYVVEFALETKDVELERYAARLSSVIDLYPEPSLVLEESKGDLKTEPVDDLDAYSAEVTPEEIYQAQVAHHYIGALR